jgi:hypothetical protein
MFVTPERPSVSIHAERCLSRQWDDGLTPSRGVWCLVVARSKAKTSPQANQKAQCGAARPLVQHTQTSPRSAYNLRYESKITHSAEQQCALRSRRKHHDTHKPLRYAANPLLLSTLPTSQLINRLDVISDATRPPLPQRCQHNSDQQ